MDLHVHVDINGDPRTQEILQLLQQIKHKMEGITVSLDALTTAVTENTNASDSVIVLINGLVTQLQAALAGNNPAAVQALVDQIQGNTAELAKAVTDNTPPA